jgi:uncharacterized membrane protein YeaQ/YmgE (transglycosylase-associated protein family)
MNTILFLLSVAVAGFVVGGLARLILPGKDPIGLLATFMLGIVGAFLGGIAEALVAGERNVFGLVAAVFFAALLLYVVRKLNGGGLMDPGEG